MGIIFKQFLKFGIIGVSNTIISLSIYYLLLNFGINYILANIVGFIISVLNAFFWNNKYVFKNSLNKKNKVLKTYISYGITFVLSNLLLFIFVNFLGISKIIVPIMNLVIITPINFILSKYWAFK